MSTVAAWLAGLTARERRLVMVAAAVAGTVLATMLGLAVRDDLAALRARVAARERQLTEVRRLAEALCRHAAPVVAAESSLFGRLEAAATDVVGREHIASMTPVTTAAGPGLIEERVTMRLSGASLADTVRLLHGLASTEPPLAVAALTLREHVDDPTHFDATLEAVERRAAP